MSCQSGVADILVIGLGNPILGDDGVGWRVVEGVHATLLDRHGVEVDCMAVGGLGLMERMLGYTRVILVDAMDTGEKPLGTVSTFALEDLDTPGAGHTASAHDASLATALRTAEALGAAVPHRVEIVAVEARVGHTFTESLSTEVATAVPVAVGRVLKLLGTQATS